jgi:homoserine dehydrogenase
MAAPLRIALAGLGTVGAGLVRLLEANGALIERRAGRQVAIVAVSARDRLKDRGVDLAPYAWEDDMTALAARDDVDVVVELVGGADGPALTTARKALAGGKALVTANKAMIAHHGLELAKLAEGAHDGRGVALKFEAAVAGGIPVIKGLREGAAANRIERIYGILNGTCNYILSTMETTGRDFGEVLAEAQALGYAEADPTFDVEGVDAAHKLAILAAIAFGARVDFAAVEGATNAVVPEGNFSGRLLFQGAGAGDGPTASAVAADLIDIARGDVGAPFSVPVAALEAYSPADAGHRTNRTYLRFTVADRPGVLAEIATAMRDAGVSIESLIQQGHPEEGGDVLVAMVTHEGPEASVAKALRLLDGSESLTEPPLVMHLLG